MLIGHVARATTVWRQPTLRSPSVVLFQGPQFYITQGWYPSKAEHGKVVLTWNNLVAHVHATAGVVEDRDWILDRLNRLTDTLEAHKTQPSQVGDAPSDYIEKQMRAVVGIEIAIGRVECKLKVSQDEDMPNRHGTVKGLLSTSSEPGKGMAALLLNAITTETPPS